MIAVDRFIARSSDRDAWLAARAEGVTATQVARAAAGPKALQAELDLIANPVPVEPNMFMAWGSYREHAIGLQMKERYGVMPNDWLVCAEGKANRWQLATPDGLSLDHTLIGEYKTGGRAPHLPANYRRQIQWQLYVTGADACAYAYEQRHEVDGAFVPAWDLYVELVTPDDKEIRKLVSVAEQLQEHAVFLSQMERV